MKSLITWAVFIAGSIVIDTICVLIIKTYEK